MARADLVGAALAILLVAACSDSDDPRSDGGGDGAPTAEAPPSAEERCSDGSGAGMEVVQFDGAGAPLYGLEFGSGPRGVVLVHGSGGGGLCAWTQEMPALAEAGYHLLALDRTCVGASGCGQRGTVDDLEAAVGTLHELGATSVVVAGISASGYDTLIAAARLGTSVDGAMVISPASDAGISGDTPPTTAAEAAPMMRTPVLYAVAKGDGASSVEDVTDLYNATPSEGTELAVLTLGAGHGTILLYPDHEATAPGGAFFQRCLDFLGRASAP